MKYTKIFLFALAGIAFSCNNSVQSQTAEQSTQNQTAMKNSEAEQGKSQDEATDQSTAKVGVVMETNKGKITIELDPERAPATVQNFLTYVDEGFYDGTIFHRVISNFMIQGGGFTPDGTQKSPHAPIILESQNGLSNVVGSIAMARTNAPNSATCQFFINVSDNVALDYRPGNAGYAVFGHVTSGMDVVNDIRQVKTGTFNRHGDWPTEPVIIEKVYRE